MSWKQIDKPVLTADELHVHGAQFGMRLVSGGAPNGLVELYSEDDENWHYVDTFNFLWLGDLLNVTTEMKEKIQQEGVDALL